MNDIDVALGCADSNFTKASVTGVLAAEVRRLREENERKNRLFADAVSALAAIDAALGMPEDGCNSTDKTITAIKLMHAVRVDDEKEITRLTEENERLRKDAERFNWIALNAKEQLAPESLHGEFAEHKTMYVLPKLIAWADFCGNIPFTEAVDYAIDAARGAK